MTETALGTSENAKSNNLPHSSQTTQDTPITQALIAIAEQLRISNLIALANSGEVFNSAARAYQGLESLKIEGVGILSRNVGSLKPDIAEALGIEESDHE